MFSILNVFLTHFKAVMFACPYLFIYSTFMCKVEVYLSHSDY